jgi:hypothetical protein
MLYFSILRVYFLSIHNNDLFAIILVVFLNGALIYSGKFFLILDWLHNSDYNFLTLIISIFLLFPSLNSITHYLCSNEIISNFLG